MLVSVQIAHKQKLRIEWNVGPQAIAQLKKLAIEDRCVNITSYSTTLSAYG